MRKPMVTRTITFTKATIKTVNVKTEEIKTVELVLPREVKGGKLEKLIHLNVDTDEVKAINIVSSETLTKIYGMSEEEFVQNAKELDPETRKTLE